MVLVYKEYKYTYLENSIVLKAQLKGKHNVKDYSMKINKNVILESF